MLASASAISNRITAGPQRACSRFSSSKYVKGFPKPISSKPSGALKFSKPSLITVNASAAQETEKPVDPYQGEVSYFCSTYCVHPTHCKI